MLNKLYMYDYSIILLNNGLNNKQNTIWRKISKSFYKFNTLVHSSNILYKTPKCLTNAAQVSDKDHGSINALTCLCTFVLHKAWNY